MMEALRRCRWRRVARIGQSLPGTPDRGAAVMPRPAILVHRGLLGRSRDRPFAFRGTAARCSSPWALGLIWRPLGLLSRAAACLPAGSAASWRRHGAGTVRRSAACRAPARSSAGARTTRLDRGQGHRRALGRLPRRSCRRGGSEAGRSAAGALARSRRRWIRASRIGRTCRAGLLMVSEARVIATRSRAGRPAPELDLRREPRACMGARARAGGRAHSRARGAASTRNCGPIRPLGAGAPALDLRLPRRPHHRLGLLLCRLARHDAPGRARSPPRSRAPAMSPSLAGRPRHPGGGARRRAARCRTRQRHVQAERAARRRPAWRCCWSTPGPLSTWAAGFRLRRSGARPRSRAGPTARSGRASWRRTRVVGRRHPRHRADHRRLLGSVALAGVAAQLSRRSRSPRSPSRACSPACCCCRSGPRAGGGAGGRRGSRAPPARALRCGGRRASRRTFGAEPGPSTAVLPWAGRCWPRAVDHGRRNTLREAGAATRAGASSRSSGCACCSVQRLRRRLTGVEASRYIFSMWGRATAHCIRTPGGRWLVVDAGPASGRDDAGRRVVAPFLERHGVRRWPRSSSLTPTPTTWEACRRCSDASASAR